MPFRCAAAGCRGNYDGEPSVPMVKFPKDPEERQRWIDAMLNPLNTRWQPPYLDTAFRHNLLVCSIPGP